MPVPGPRFWVLLPTSSLPTLHGLGQVTERTALLSGKKALVAQNIFAAPGIWPGKVSASFSEPRLCLLGRQVRILVFTCKLRKFDLGLLEEQPRYFFFFFSSSFKSLHR